MQIMLMGVPADTSEVLVAFIEALGHHEVSHGGDVIILGSGATDDDWRDASEVACAVVLLLDSGEFSPDARALAVDALTLPLTIDRLQEALAKAQDLLARDPLSVQLLLQRLYQARMQEATEPAAPRQSESEAGLEGELLL